MHRICLCAALGKTGCINQYRTALHAIYDKERIPCRVIRMYVVTVYAQLRGTSKTEAMLYFAHPYIMKVTCAGSSWGSDDPEAQQQEEH